MAQGKFIGVTIPQYLYEFIQDEIETALYSSPSEWIRSACREYYEKRKRDRAGGGALTNPFAQKFWVFPATFMY